MSLLTEYSTALSSATPVFLSTNHETMLGKDTTYIYKQNVINVTGGGLADYLHSSAHTMTPGRSVSDDISWVCLSIVIYTVYVQLIIGVSASTVDGGIISVRGPP